MPTYNTERYQKSKDEYFVEFTTKLDIVYTIVFRDSSEYLANEETHPIYEVVFQSSNNKKPHKKDTSVMKTIEQEIDWFSKFKKAVVVCVCDNKDYPACCRHRLFSRFIIDSDVEGYTILDITAKYENDNDDEFIFVFIEPSIESKAQLVLESLDELIPNVGGGKSVESKTM